jgi:phosphoribosylformylglycinamidine synthase subunit PurL
VEKLLAFAVDCNGRMCELDPFVGGAMSVAEVCRNLACSGAEPIGVTDCLNFGNPEKPEVMDSFALAVDGIAAACDALKVPIVSGNVSLYNETDGRAILPTPTVAAVGLVRRASDIVTVPFKRAGDAVLLLGEAACSGVRALGGSEWLVQKTGTLEGQAPVVDLAAEARLQALLLVLAREGLLESAHDVSDGGLAAALAECCAVGTMPFGARIELPGQTSPVDAVAALFGEAPSRVVASVRPGNVSAVLERARAPGVPARAIGDTGGDVLSIEIPPLGRLSVGTEAIRERRDACLRPIVGD